MKIAAFFKESKNVFVLITNIPATERRNQGVRYYVGCLSRSRLAASPPMAINPNVAGSGTAAAFCGPTRKAQSPLVPKSREAGMILAGNGALVSGSINVPANDELSPTRSAEVGMYTFEKYCDGASCTRASVNISFTEEEEAHSSLLVHWVN